MTVPEDRSQNVEPASEANGGTKKPRLFIKEMVVKNFKSYAGEQRVGPFHKSFSAVVGPNGSGKSNVIDAMLFVFGKRAKQVSFLTLLTYEQHEPDGEVKEYDERYKSMHFNFFPRNLKEDSYDANVKNSGFSGKMRLNKVSELIHTSTNHQNLDSASVSVHFQEIIDLDDGTYKVVSGSDFVITRVAFRDNSSKYYINDRGSNFTEVTKKLKAKGVDLDNNRFLILQGEVEQISLMKPKAQGPHDEGFLEYLEDIIGTNQYVAQIDDFYKQLESLNEKRSSAVQMLKLAEKERDNLENVKNEAEAYMLKELSLLKWQEKSTKLASDDAASHLSELQDTLSSLEVNLKDEREKICQTSSKLKDLEVVYNKYLKRQQELDGNLRTCKEEFKDFERQDVKYREDLKYLKQKIKKLEDKLEKDSAKIEETKKQNEKSAELIPSLENDIPKLQQLLMDEEKVLEEVKEFSKGETERYRSELMAVRVELEPWEKQLIEHQGKHDVACTEKKLLKEKHHAGQVAFEDAQCQMNDITEKIKAKDADMKKLNAELDRNRKEALEARKVEQECINKQDSLIPLEQAARQKLTELLSASESEKSQGSVLKALSQAKEMKQIEGIHGRLGDLGAIDAKYDVAISMACPGLDYIVVETTTAAQACVELLRRKDLGVATFLILEKQVHHLQRLKEKVKTPEGAPRLFDLITVADGRMKLAFFALLQNTIVAKDLDQATRIAYGGHKDFRRVVTLDGALFEKSGTMSGGGGKPRGGRMGTSIRVSVSGEAVASAEEELGQLVEQHEALRQRIGDAVKCYTAAERAVSHLEMELAKSQKEIDSLNAQYTYIEKQLDNLKAASQPKKEELNRLEELDKIISSEQKDLKSLTKGSKELQEKAAELQTKIENAGGDRLKNQKSKVDKIQSEIDRNNSEINRHKVQIVTGEKMLKKLMKGIEESKKERDRLVEEKEKMLAAFKQIEEKAFIVQENYKKTQELLDKHRDVLDEAKTEYNKLKKIVDESRAAEVDAEYKLKDAKKFCEEKEVKIKGYNKRLNELKKRIENHIEQIHKDGIDAEKLQATLMDETLREACDLKRALEMVALLESQLKDMNPNLDSISEYRTKASLYNSRVEELNAVTEERDNIKRQYDELRKKRLDEFMAGFNTISLKLKEMYQMITLGGDAELELVDSLDPFSEGVVFSVRPPKKSWKNIANLSGGEKTLSSLALVFALHHYKPTPLYVMDEIDAALDFKNVSIVGHYVKDRTKDAQFIIISLRNNMFELADCLVGIYKTDNCTKSITINPRSFAVTTKAC